jgi:hypothetical protein
VVVMFDDGHVSSLLASDSLTVLSLLDGMASLLDSI